MGDIKPRSPLESFFKCINDMIEGPVIKIRSFVESSQQKDIVWYHQKFRRVPTIDQCYEDDPICYHEANMQFKRDRQVESEILNVLRLRFEDCVLYESPDHLKKCKPILDQYKEAETNWFIKYGDLGAYGDVRAAYMKQKHRMIWERRYGSVGSGMQS